MKYRLRIYYGTEYDIFVEAVANDLNLLSELAKSAIKLGQANGIPNLQCHWSHWVMAPEDDTCMWQKFSKGG